MEDRSPSSLNERLSEMELRLSGLLQRLIGMQDIDARAKVHKRAVKLNDEILELLKTSRDANRSGGIASESDDAEQN